MLKKLREDRKESILAVSLRVKQQSKAIEAIRRHLKNGPGTVPEITSALGMPSSEVMWYIAALKKYGEIVEGDKDGSFYRYQLPGGSDAEPVSDSTGKASR